MSSPKFAAGEILLLRSQWYPECNGKYTVLEVNRGYGYLAVTYALIYCTHYKLDDGPGRPGFFGLPYQLSSHQDSFFLLNFSCRRSSAKLGPS